MENIRMNESLPKQNLLIRTITFARLKKSTLVEVMALLFVILFLYTGISKVMDIMLFEEQLAESPILEPVAPVVAWGLPITEFIVSISLFLPKYRLIGLYATFAIMVLFTVYVVALLMFSTELPCSCGGILEILSWPAHLVLNVVLIAIALAGTKICKEINRSGNKT